MTAILEGRELGVTRGPRLILDAATVSVDAGSFTALVGPNGSGKSTLLRALAGIWPTARGSVWLDGQPLASLPRRTVAQRLAFLPQDTRCDFGFTVEEMVAMGRHPHRGRFAPTAPADRRAMQSAIDLCDLAELRGRLVDTLSGGERQRVAIARCLAAEPAVILLDEPTAHLDLDHALGILQLCQRLADDGRAVVMASHDLASVFDAAHRIVVLKHGRIVAAGDPKSVLVPDLCRDVFSVESESVAAAGGRQALIFRRMLNQNAALSGVTEQ